MRGVEGAVVRLRLNSGANERETVVAVDDQSLPVDAERGNRAISHVPPKIAIRPARSIGIARRQAVAVKLAGIERRTAAAAALIAATVEMAESGRPLMRRVVPDDGHRVFEHYPPDDAIDRHNRSRWFYHAHPPEERGDGEHGHFHLFLDRRAFGRLPAIAGPLAPRKNDARVVHIAALTIDLSGLPVSLFTVNRWVTDEWLYGAAQISARLARFDLSGANSDPLVNRWLTAAVATFAPEIAGILCERDRIIAEVAADFFEDRTAEILSSTPIDLMRCVSQPDR